MINERNTLMRYLLYITSLFFVVCCGKKEEETTKNTEPTKNVSVEQPSPELELEVEKSPSISPELKYQISGDKAVIVRYTGTAESFTIPAEVEGVPVTEIRPKAFENCSSLKSITIGENVTKIGTWAFSGCTGLTSIDIPEKVEVIGNLAFDKCTSLEAINVSENNNTYSSEEGVLYDSGKVKMVQCLWVKRVNLVLPEG